MGKITVNVDYPPEVRTRNKSKLPKDRHIIPKDTNFKVNKIPLGCIDFEMFLKIFDYKYNHKWTNEEIAEEFDLDAKNVDDFLFYFKPFNNRVIDKQPLTVYKDYCVDNTYVKVAQLLNRDVESFKEIPEYKRELAKIEQEKELARLIEEEDTQETEEEQMAKIENLKFKHETFYLAAKEESESNRRESTRKEKSVKKEDKMDVKVEGKKEVNSSS